MEKEKLVADIFEELNNLLKDAIEREQNKEEENECKELNVKITIDTKNKTIKLHSDTKISDLFDFLEGMDIDIDEYSIVATETISFPYYPVTPSYPYIPQPITTPDYPWTSPTIIW